MPINKFTTLLDLARQAKILTGETATFDGKIQAGIPFSGYPTGVDTGSTVSLGIVSSEDAVFSGNTGTTIFDVSNPLSPNYDALFSGYTATTWTNPIFSANTSGLTLPITPFSADTQIVGPFWTLTQTGMTGDYVIGTQYTGYSVTYSFNQISSVGTGGTEYSGFTTAIQENFSAGTLDYKGPLDYLSTKEDATVEGRLTTNKITITNGASASTIGYVLTQLDETGKAGWVYNSASGSTDTYVTGGTLTGTNLILGWNTGGSATPVDLSGLLFTGNTSASCITDLYVTNLYGCSPITVWDSIQSVGSTASGTTSFAFGINNVSSGIASFAEGSNTTASGVASHAEGNSTSATTFYAHSEGSFTLASGQSSHAEGNGTIASGNQSHAEGFQTIASGNTSHAEGLNSVAGGNYSHAEGFNTIASGEGSHAEGSNTTASGIRSHAEGAYTIASGDTSHAEGYYTQSFGLYSHAEGGNTIASGNYSHAEGQGTIASGDYSHAEGNGTTASGDYSHAEGRQTTASGQYSHAEGRFTIASGERSHAEGGATQAIGDYSHSEGTGTIASGETSHAEGSGSIAYGASSHAQGYNTLASADYSHAGGDTSSAYGNVSFIHSRNSIVTGDRSVVLGGQNITGVTTDTVYVPYLNVKDNLGIGTEPSYKFHIVSGNTQLYYDPTSAGSRLLLSGTTGLPRIDVVIPPYLTNPLTGGGIGLRSWDDVTYLGYGKVGDMHVYAGVDVNGLNIINSGPGTNSEDYIRFYAGQDANFTADVHIQGSGSTRGYVGIGTETPTEKLDVNGKTKTINFQMTSGATNGYVLTSDASGNASWQSATSGSSCDCTFTGGTISGETTFTDGLSATTFTGNTIWTERIKGRLGQIKINDDDEGNVYFGSTSGITLDVPNSRIGIKTANPTTELDVSGKTKTINFQMTSGATSGYVLTSDASGNASWQVATSGVWSAGTGTNSAVLNNSGSVASGTTSVAEGLGTIAGGDASHAEGLLTIASGNYSHAEGQQTIASGDYSHAEGNNTIASGNSSHAEGILTIASGNMSHAEGGGTVASGTWSHAGGFSSTASGSASFIHSTNSLVTGARSVVLGGQNITGSADDTVYVPYLNIDSIGTGTSVNNLGIDVNGNVVTGTAGGGIPEATTATTTTINFTGQTIYYNAGSPGTGNITQNLTGSKLGLIQKIYHNDGTEPTYPAGWVLMGDAIYFTSTLNIIYAEWAGGSRVEYWYVQEQ